MKILDITKLKAFADDKLNVAERANQQVSANVVFQKYNYQLVTW